MTTHKDTRTSDKTLTDEGTPRPPMEDKTTLSADDRIGRLESDVAELRRTLVDTDSDHFSHHARLDSSGYGR